MRLRISEPALLPELVALLVRHGCIAHADRDDSCVLVHVHARDEEEAWCEMRFFLSAWRTEHADVSATLTR